MDFWKLVSLTVFRSSFLVFVTFHITLGKYIGGQEAVILSFGRTKRKKKRLTRSLTYRTDKTNLLFTSHKWTRQSKSGKWSQYFYLTEELVWRSKFLSTLPWEVTAYADLMVCTVKVTQFELTKYERASLAVSTASRIKKKSKMTSLLL